MDDVKVGTFIEKALKKGFIVVAVIAGILVVAWLLGFI